MFEQAVLPSHPAGFSAELLVIGLALLAPLIWTDFLPRVEALNWISLPAPPAAASKPLPERVVRPTHPWQTVGNILLRPTVIPPTALLIEDPPGAVPGGSASDGVQVPAGAGVLATLLDSLAHAVPPQRVAAPAVVAQPAPAAPAAPAGALAASRRTGLSAPRPHRPHFRNSRADGRDCRRWTHPRAAARPRTSPAGASGARCRPAMDL